MLNITQNKLNEKVDISNYKSVTTVSNKTHFKMFNRLLKVFFIICLFSMFLPWTQNIKGRGYVTTLLPGQRPQTIHSAIAGRIEKWYVREGDLVRKGDTILFISEIKDDYFDPMLVERTGQQVKAKELSVVSYTEKVKVLDKQITAIQNEQGLKLQQAQNKLRQSQLKVKSDSIDLKAAETQLSIATRQYDRVVQLHSEGLKAMTDVEEKQLKLQESQAKIISAENKLLAAKNEVINAEVELNRIRAEYTDKISKAESDKFTALSNQYDAEAQVTKLQNQQTNYEVRTGLHYITAPQSGYINKALQSGLGETFKEGAAIVGIMPDKFDMAVETYVEPIDLPLIHVGEKIRIQFDGWPTIFFSGWPNVSYGTYGGKIVAIENFISENGKYRILVAPDPGENPWPDVRVGSGAFTMALLKDVPVWFELWRKLNGFPPNYYKPVTPDNTGQKDKK
ncbi:HlyD family secretion protein [Abyssalbus ytuae]|uniref:HlyD family secretion protein n=1 Tax=Abyssalbus ytuae TaxID=2926907 RepID=A0A9E7CT54_9FLAO|nr:biotin/lipoyl-binding protein [Abyssalbus ytuae]UOB17501.1 HlyD family secretion protein [Abyssalbus ytuae]